MLAEKVIGMTVAGETKTNYLDRQAAIAHLGELTLSGMACEQVRRHVLQLAHRSTHADYTAFLSLDEKAGEMRMLDGIGWPEGVMDTAILGVGGTSQAGFTLLNRDPVLVTDLDQEQRFAVPDICQHVGVRSGLTVRVAGVDHIYGVLGVHASTPQAFRVEDVTFLQVLANHLAMSLDHNHLSRSEQAAASWANTMFETLPAGLLEWDVSAMSMMVRTLKKMPEDEAMSYLHDQQGLEQTMAGGVMIKRANPMALQLLEANDVAELQANLTRLFHVSQGQLFRRILAHVAYDHLEPFTVDMEGLNGTRFTAVIQVTGVPSDNLHAVYTWFGDATTDNHDDLVLRNKFRSQASQLRGSLMRERSLTRELRLALEREKELSTLKSRFVAMASHEFRTPLSAIMAAAGTLRAYGEKMDQGQRRDRLDKIHNEVHTLVHLLDDILEIGRTSDPRAELQPAWIDLQKQCAGIVAETETVCDESNRIQLELVDVADKVFLDPRCLRNILSNLLSNAVKYSSRGAKVHLKVRVTPLEISFCVSDHGIGIPPSERSMILEPFYRADNVGVVQGNGLGLAIVNRAVELQGGRMTITSAVGEGTTFCIYLPHVTQGEVAS